MKERLLSLRRQSSSSSLVSEQGEPGSLAALLGHLEVRQAAKIEYILVLVPTIYYNICINTRLRWLSALHQTRVAPWRA